MAASYRIITGGANTVTAEIERRRDHGPWAGDPERMEADAAAGPLVPQRQFWADAILFAYWRCRSRPARRACQRRFTGWLDSGRRR
jgi:hypothetical protein